jgi:hypothetical protein
MSSSLAVAARSLLVSLSIGVVACSGNTALGPAASEAAVGSPGADAGATSPTPQAEPACSATPKQLLDFNVLARDLGASPSPEVSPLAVLGSSVYFVFDKASMGGGTLLSLPLQGGAYTALRNGIAVLRIIDDPVATPTAVVLHEFPNDVTNDEEILAVSQPSGAPRILTTSNGPVSGITANDSNVYFVDHDGLKSVPLAGGRAQLLSDAISDVTASGLAVVGSNIVATTVAPDLTSSGALYEVPLGGGSPTMLPTGQPSNFFPMACGSDVCWAMGPDLGRGPGFIARLSGGAVTTISAATVPGSLSFDGTSFYATVGPDGSLVRIPASGGPAVTMAGAYTAAVAGDCVYYMLEQLETGGGIDPGSGIYVVRK